MRSAKQKANDRRLGQMAKKRRASKRVKSSTTRRKPMARRRRATRRSRASGSIRRVVSRKSGSKIVSTIKPMAQGIGGGLILETVANQVAPQFGQVAGYGGAYLFGGVKGVLGKVAFDVLSGKGLGLGGLIGGNSTPVEVSV